MALNKSSQLFICKPLGIILLVLSGLQVCIASTMTLDFQADTSHDAWAGINGGQISCNFSGATDNNCGQGAGILDTTNNDTDNTPFLLEKVTVGGQQYFHMIMGDPNADMAQEYYVSATGSGVVSKSSLSPATDVLRSASNGDGCYDSSDPLCGTNLQLTSGNGWDPLAKLAATTNANTGNGSGNPEKTIMRQVTGTGTWDPATMTRTCTDEVCQEFLKETFANKPVITQETSSTQGGDTMTATFKMDMSGSDYLTDTAAAAVINTLDFSAFSGGKFDHATDSTDPTSVTGGQYTYTAGTAAGDNNGSGGSFSKGFDPSTFDYGAFRSPSQNTVGAGNAWK